MVIKMVTDPHDESLVQGVSCSRVYYLRQLAEVRTVVQYIQKVLPGQIVYTWANRNVSLDRYTTEVKVQANCRKVLKN